MYFYACQSVGIFMCSMVVHVFVGAISNQSTSKTMSSAWKVNLTNLFVNHTQQGASGTKVLRLDKSRSRVTKKISVSKLTYYIWCEKKTIQGIKKKKGAGLG